MTFFFSNEINFAQIGQQRIKETGSRTSDYIRSLDLDECVLRPVRGFKPMLNSLRILHSSSFRLSPLIPADGGKNNRSCYYQSSALPGFERTQTLAKRIIRHFDLIKSIPSDFTRKEEACGLIDFHSMCFPMKRQWYQWFWIWTNSVHLCEF